MAEDRQPPNVVEGATTGADVDEDVPAAKSAEDRKAAAALSKLDVHRDDDDAAPAREVDQEAVSRAMDSLGGDAAAGKKIEEKKDVKKVKVDPADVALLVGFPSFCRRGGWMVPHLFLRIHRSSQIMARWTSSNLIRSRRRSS